MQSRIYSTLAFFPGEWNKDENHNDTNDDIQINNYSSG